MLRHCQAAPLQAAFEPSALAVVGTVGALRGQVVEDEEPQLPGARSLARLACSSEGFASPRKVLVSIQKASFPAL